MTRKSGWGGGSVEVAGLVSEYPSIADCSSFFYLKLSHAIKRVLPENSLVSRDFDSAANAKYDYAYVLRQ